MHTECMHTHTRIVYTLRIRLLYSIYIYNKLQHLVTGKNAGHVRHVPLSGPGSVQSVGIHWVLTATFPPTTKACMTSRIPPPY